MEIEFLSVADLEFADAVDYYNQKSEGLGFEFAAEVKRSLERIVQYPEAWTPLSKRTRRCRTRRFPYGVVYQVRSNRILIVAVMHLQRDPIHGNVASRIRECLYWPEFPSNDDFA